MNFQHLDRTQILKRLQTTKEYKGWSQQKISDHLGNHVFKFRKELDRIENKFHYFLNLPDDIQAVILLYDKSLLKKSLQLCHAMRASPPIKSAYFHTFCNQPLNYHEIHNFVRFHGGDAILLNNNGHLTCYYKTKDDQFSYMTRTYSIDKWYGHKIVYRRHDYHNRIIDCQHYKMFDLLSFFNMFKNRQCDWIKKDYSYIKTKEKLQLFYDSIIMDSYESLLILFMYLKLNLKQCGVKTPKYSHQHDVVDVTRDNTLLIHNLKQQVDVMFQQLNDCIMTF